MKAVTDWLAEATHVYAEAANQVLTVSPWRRQGKRDARIGQKGDPMTAVPVSDPPAIAVALKNMLAVRLPTAR